MISAAQCTCTGNTLNIQNPSFESGTTGWYWSGGNLNAGTGAVKCGSKSGDFQITNNSNNWVSQTVGTDLPIGTVLQAKVYAGTHDNNYYHKVGIAYFDANWNYLSETNVEVNKVLSASPSGPQLYTINSTVPSNCKYTVIGYGGNGNWIKTDAWCVTYTSPTTGSIGDRVWLDANANGLQDANETVGITGVQVQLKNSAGTVIRTTTTNSTGNYSFTGLAAGNYSVAFPVSIAGSVVTRQNVGSNDNIDSDPSQSTGNTGTISLASGQNITNVDAGYCPVTMQLGNRVWYDKNGDGLNGDEDGIRGITVNLYKDDNNDNVADGGPIATDITDGDGFYNFANLAPGNYIVGVIKPAGYVSSPVNGGDPDNDINLDDNGQVEVSPNEVRGLAITLVSGTEPKIDGNTDGDNNITYDFGLLPDCACTTSSSNLLVNGNFENGTTGWSWSGGSLTTGTGYVACGNKNGFNNWASGTSWVYQDVNVTQGTTLTFKGFAGTHTPGLNCSPKLQLQFFNSSNSQVSISSVNVTRDVDVNHNQLEQYSIVAAVPAGAVRVRVQSAINCNTMKMDAFCLTSTAPPATGSIGDRVWYDANGNGIQDASETIGLTGVTINLRNSGGTVIQTKTTDANGNYLFTGLAAGTYTVAFPITINGSVVTRQNQGTDDNVDSDPSQTTGVTPNVVLAAGQNITNVDAGYCPTTLVLGNFVFNDVNNNGVQNVGEPGISGATVKLYKDDNADGVADGASIATVTTDANGLYTFINLAPGNFIVGVTLPNGYVAGATTATSATPNNNNNTDNNGTNLVGNEIRSSYITLTGGGEPTNDGDGADGNLTLDFGLVGNGSIGNFVWNDLNGNGLQDAGEPGIAGVTVNLKNGAGTVIATTTTSSTGAYLFSNVTAGTYSVEFSTPNGFVPAPSNVGTNDAIDSDPVNGTAINVVVVAGVFNDTVDAGFVVNTLSLGDFVWNDYNNNGIQDANEPGVVGVTVSLYRDNDGNGTADGVAATTYVTTGNGFYTFDNLTPGSYVIGITLPAGYSAGATTSTSAVPNNNNNTDNNGTNTSVAGEVRSGTITLTTGGEPDVAEDGDDTNSNATVDFAVKGKGSIGDFVFNDLNNDGIQNAGEPGIAGVLVTLKDAANVTVATSTTNASGNYLFANVAPGTYSVVFTSPVGFVASPSNVGDDALDSDPIGGVVSGIVLAANQNNLTIDAGFANNGLSVGNFVWNDLNNNGLQDAGEPGVAGVTVEVFKSNNNGVPTSAALFTATTDANGVYTFTGLTPGKYVVAITTPAGYAQGATTATSADPDTDNNSDNNGVNTTQVAGKIFTGAFQLSTNGEPDVAVDGDGTNSNQTIDFGLKGTGTIGDFVWNDYNGDGLQTAGEPGLAGVTVTLKNAAGVTLYTQTTTSNGAYSFTNLAPGTYSVTFSTPAGYAATTSKVGTNDNIDSDPVAGVVSNIVLTAGQTRNTVDAGFVATNLVIGNFVWNDFNDNGIQNTGEPGIAGVTVKLYADANTDGIADGTALATVTTNASGIYTFTGRKPGSYVVGITLPAGYAAGATTATSATPNNDNNTDNNGTNTSVAGEVRSSTITISTLGEPATGVDGDDTNGNLTVDFALKGTGSIGNFVWNDVNNNGLQDNGELGLPGVLVTLKNAAGLTVATATTDANGAYSFARLAPSTYSVTFATPNGYIASPANVGTNDAIDSDPVGGVVTGIVLAAGENNDTVDAGFVSNVVNLGDFVWYDLNNDGLQDAGEPGIAGVVVNLYTDNDANNIADGASIATTTTNANGIYNFANLAPGRYIASIVVPAGYSASLTSTSGLNPDNNSNTDNNGITLIGNQLYTNAITLTPGQEPALVDDGDGLNGNLTLDFGLKGHGSIGDFVFNDNNQNGIQDANDAGIPNAIVTLTYPGGATLSTTTDADGKYVFNYLIGGTYSVAFSTPAGYQVSPANQGTDDEKDSDPVNGVVAGIALTNGQTNNSVDAGFYKTISLSGNLFNDANALLDNRVNKTSNEALPVGLRVYLVDAATGIIEQVGFLPTDGTYNFDNVQTNKNYRVVISSISRAPGQSVPRVALPSGWRNTGEHLGATPGSDGVVDGTIFIQTQQSNVTEVNFGIRKQNGEIVIG